MTQTAAEMRDRIHRVDLRRRRAEVFVHHALQCIKPHLRDDADMQKIFYDIFDAAYEAGAEILFDAERARLGLSPRGPDGWTDDEIRAYDSRFLLEMLKPISVTLPIK